MTRTNPLCASSTTPVFCSDPCCAGTSNKPLTGDKGGIMNLYLFVGNAENEYTHGIICVIAATPEEAVTLAIAKGEDSFDNCFTIDDDGNEWGWHIGKTFEVKNVLKKGRVYEDWDNC